MHRRRPKIDFFAQFLNLGTLENNKPQTPAKTDLYDAGENQAGQQHRLSRLDFESAAYANFATPAQSGVSI